MLDEIRHDPKLDFRLPPCVWLHVAVAVGPITAAAIVVTGGGACYVVRPAGAPSVRRPPDSLVATVPARIPLLASQSDNMTLLGLTAWISNWPAGKVVGVSLATSRIIRALHQRLCGAASEFCREVFRDDGPITMR